jgi:hypothetical protein
MTKRTYHGSCHCGAVRFAVRLDLTKGVNRCNCTFCTKTKAFKVYVPNTALELLAGIDALTDYRAPGSAWPEGHIHHYFCRHCGVRGFSRGFFDAPPLNGWFWGVNVNALDDATDEEIATAPVILEDNRTSSPTALRATLQRTVRPRRR